MADGNDNSTNRTDSADSLIRRLGARYLIVLALVALLMVVDQAVVQPLLVRLDAYAPAINLSGRQRMLSQKLTKAALAFQASDDETARSARRAELRETLDQWSRCTRCFASRRPAAWHPDDSTRRKSRLSGMCSSRTSTRCAPRQRS